MRWLILCFAVIAVVSVPLRVLDKRRENILVSRTGDDDSDSSDTSQLAAEAQATNIKEAATLANGVGAVTLSPSVSSSRAPHPLPLINNVNQNLADKQSAELRNLARKQATQVADLASERTQLLQDQPVERQNQRISQTQELADQQQDFRFNIRSNETETKELAALKNRQTQDVNNLVAKQAQELADIELRLQNLKKAQDEEYKVLINAQQMDRDDVALMDQHDLRGTPLTYLSSGRLITPAVARAMVRVDQATSGQVKAHATMLFLNARPPKRNLTDGQLWDAKLSSPRADSTRNLNDLGLDVAVPGVPPIGYSAGGGETDNEASQSGTSNGNYNANSLGFPTPLSVSGTGSDNDDTMSNNNSASGSRTNALSGSDTSSKSGSDPSSKSGRERNNRENLMSRFTAGTHRELTDPNDLARIAAVAPALPVTLKQIDNELNIWAKKPVDIGTVLASPPADPGPVCDCCLKKIAPDPIPPIAKPGGCHCPNCTKGLTYKDFSNAAGGPVGLVLSTNSSQF